MNTKQSWSSQHRRIVTLERWRDVLGREIAPLSADPIREAGVRARKIELARLPRKLAAG